MPMLSGPGVQHAELPRYRSLDRGLAPQSGRPSDREWAGRERLGNTGRCCARRGVAIGGCGWQHDHQRCERRNYWSLRQPRCGARAALCRTGQGSSSPKMTVPDVSCHLRSMTRRPRREASAHRVSVAMRQGLVVTDRTLGASRSPSVNLSKRRRKRLGTPPEGTKEA